MKTKPVRWQSGRGRIGLLAPLMGAWQAVANTPMGKARCTRTFTPILGGKFIQLFARWEMGKGMYEETAILGINNGKLSFWSFTSDGKRSEGVLANGKDVHPQAIAFEAEMPAGRARMLYWPHEQEGFNWAVEARTAKGWRRFTEHHYVAL
jgi:hypothetical protein